MGRHIEGENVEYRAVSRIFQNIDPPLSPPSESVLPRTKGGGVHTRRAVRGWGINILEDERQRIGLLQYNLSTGTGITSRGEGSQQMRGEEI